MTLVCPTCFGKGTLDGDRPTRALDLRLAGRTLREIADAFEVGPTRARDLVLKGAKRRLELPERTGEVGVAAKLECYLRGLVEAERKINPELARASRRAVLRHRAQRIGG